MTNDFKDEPLGRDFNMFDVKDNCGRHFGQTLAIWRNWSFPIFSTIDHVSFDKAIEKARKHKTIDRVNISIYVFVLFRMKDNISTHSEPSGKSSA
jgi:hypothetical protein